MPQPISECGDVLVFGSVTARLLRGSLMLVLCVQVSLVGVLKILSGAFVSGQVIFFSVMLGAAAMGMGGKIVVLGSNLLRFAHEVARARIVPSGAPGRQRRARLHNSAGSANLAFRVQSLHSSPLSFR